MTTMVGEKITGSILVVDDEPANRELLRAQLVSEGHEVFTAKDGRVALAEFERVHPDLVLLDVLMPNLDGFEVCRILKENPDTRLVPVVIVTALTATHDRIKGIEVGADDFLTKPFERQQLLARVQALLSLKSFTDELERAETVLTELAWSIEAKDPFTTGHCQRMAGYCVQLGRELGLDGDHLVALRRAGSVHDIGKVAVPDAILLKPSRLTEAEMRLVMEHPIVGERICLPMKSFAQVLPIIRHHHEKQDGSGYPDGLRGDQVPFCARILQIADVYDALTTERPFKSCLPVEEALGVMQEEVDRGWWDAQVFAAFRLILGRGPGHSTALAPPVEMYPCSSPR